MSCFFKSLCQNLKWIRLKYARGWEVPYIKRWKLGIVLSITVVLCGVPLISAFSTPFVNPIIVLFGNSEGEIAVVSRIKSEFPSTIIVEYGSPQHAMVLWRAISDVIYVAHGSKDGIVQGSQTIRWTNFVGTALGVPSESQYFASCYSQEAVQIASSRRPEARFLGFDGVIDAELASLCITTLMHATRGSRELAMNNIYEFFELAVAKTLNPEGHRFLPLAVIDLFWGQFPPFPYGNGYAWGWVDGRPTIGGAYYSGNWYSGSYVMAMSGPWVLTIPGNGIPATHSSSIVHAIASWWCWATGQWYSDPYVYYMTVQLSTSQRTMLALPALASSMFYFISFGSSVFSLLGLFVVLVVGILNFFLSIIAPYISFVYAFLNDPGLNQIWTYLLNYIDAGSFFYSLLAWDICRPK